MGLAERKEWASHVLDKLFPQLSNEKRVVVFAGRRYREFLVDHVASSWLGCLTSNEPPTRALQ
jgi:hypothetical protein